MTKALGPSDTITITFTGTANWSTRAAKVYRFSGLAPAAKDVVGTASGYGHALDVASTGATSQGNELVLGTFAIASGTPGFVPDPGFTALEPLSVPGTGHTFQPEFRVVTDGGAAQHAIAQLGVDASHTDAVVAYRGSWTP